MDLVKILRSLEEFLFELISWLLFFPLTLWRVVRHPLGMAAYAVSELGDKEDNRFSDSVSPPMFLILAVILAHVLELSLHDIIPGAGGALGQMLVGNEQGLMLFRAVIFSIWPLLGAVAYLRGTKQSLDRDTLRPPFFALCFLTGPFAIAFSGGSAVMRHDGGTYGAVGAAVMLAAIVWYIVVQSRWFAQTLAIGQARAFGLAVAAFLGGGVLNVVIGVVLLTA
ncbi:MAG: hypothetical protein V4466_11560 [Pseudomonadota bacterium]